MKMTWKFLFALLMAVSLTACSSGSAPSYSALPGSTAGLSGSSALASAKTGGDTIAPQDLLEIEVFKVPDLSKEVRVDDSGKITLPLIGSVQASGLTASRLEQSIAASLEKDYMRNPQVKVLVKESNSNNVTVGGAVNKPGIYPLKSNTTVSQAIAMAEGLSPLAVKDNVTVFRNDKPYTVQLEAINNGQIPDPVVMAGDKIQVHVNGTKEALRDYGSVGNLISPFTLFR
jgi:polysaccharide export outer membrane protein